MGQEISEADLVLTSYCQTYLQETKHPADL